MVRTGETILCSAFEQSAHEIAGALAERYLAEGEPRDLVALEPNSVLRTYCHYPSHKGMFRRFVSAMYIGNVDWCEAIKRNELEAYVFGIHMLQLLIREVGAGAKGYLTKSGLHSYIDPRLEGGKANAVTNEDLVELVEVNGEEHLWFKCFPVHVAVLRAVVADGDGNLSSQGLGMALNPLYMALAAKRWGGRVIAQVSRVVRRGSLNPKLVTVPGHLVDALVVEQSPPPSGGTPPRYLPSLAGQQRFPLPSLHQVMRSGLVYATLPWDGENPPPPANIPFSRGPQPTAEEEYPFSVDKLIARRAALELRPGMVLNCGTGVPLPYLMLVTLEEGVQEFIVPSIEHGVVGGLNAGGMWHLNPACYLDYPMITSLYYSGGLDASFLGCAQVDAEGNVNNSRFGGTLLGPGGGVDIAHGTRKVVFTAPFTSGGMKVEYGDGLLQVLKDGSIPRFVRRAQQVTFSGPDMLRRGKEVLYLTERAVFRLTPAGLLLTEAAPGVDVERDILGRMEFRPQVAPGLKSMDSRIFRREPMGLRVDIEERARGG